MYSCLRNFYKNSFLIQQLVKRDIEAKYTSSYLGLGWAVLEPIATTLILSIIFTFGFRKQGGDVPFFIYMYTGMVAFSFFSVTLAESTVVLKSYSFLLRKVNFNPYLLPIVKVLSSVLLHGIMLGLLVVSLLYYGYYPNIYWFQFLYYFFYMTIFVLGVSWGLSALCVFVPDLAHMVKIALRFLFYLLPIFWSADNMPERVLFFLKMNPMFYVIEGYRKSFLVQQPFWETPKESLCFWLVNVLIFIVGLFLFRRLKPHFMDLV